MDIQARFDEIMRKHNQKIKSNKCATVAQVKEKPKAAKSSKLKMIVKYGLIGLCVVTTIIIICICVKRIALTNKPAVQEPIDWSKVMKKEEKESNKKRSKKSKKNSKTKSKRSSKRVRFEDEVSEDSYSEEYEQEYDNDDEHSADASSFSEEDDDDLSIEDYTKLEDL